MIRNTAKKGMLCLASSYLIIENMVKYTTSMITFAEIPDEICLSFNISNCQNNCIGCHSPELRQNIGKELTEEVLLEEIKKNDGITCVLFLGEGNDKEALLRLIDVVNRHGLKTALYSGRECDSVEDEIWLKLNYLKTGPYKKEFGPLNEKTTNQQLWLIEKDSLPNSYLAKSITYKFWRKI